MRRPLVVGNWKMNGSKAQNGELVEAIIAKLPTGDESSEIAVCVPSIYIDQVAQLVEGSDLGVGSQDISVHVSGAYTGETSASMLKDNNCQWAIVGHSERRQYHHESDLLVAQKALAAIKSSITPIICVGETLDERESGETLAVIEKQLQAVQSVLGEQGLVQSVIAYEPVWAIGTGLTASPQQAQDVHLFIRQQLGQVADKVRVLYGGSVKADNAASLFAEPDIDGALVGGASLQADAFIAIAEAAGR